MSPIPGARARRLLNNESLKAYSQDANVSTLGPDEIVGVPGAGLLNSHEPPVLARGMASMRPERP